MSWYLNPGCPSYKQLQQLLTFFTSLLSCCVFFVVFFMFWKMISTSVVALSTEPNRVLCLSMEKVQSLKHF
jgi:nitrate/TMAO reductase-like tetraheme cytochrome c subunit